MSVIRIPLSELLVSIVVNMLSMRVAVDEVTRVGLEIVGKSREG